MRSSIPVLAGLDIGTSRVTFVIGLIQDEGLVEIVGVGQAANVGLKQGVVINIEATTEAIRKARDEAELMAGYTTDEVWLGVSGSHIRSFDSKGMVAIKNKEVSALDIERVIDAAQAVAVPTDRKVLHVIPREYRVDGQDGILDPLGMSGIRLEAAVHIVTASQAAISNLLKCVEKANLKTLGFVLEPLAASQAVLSNDEKNLGVCLIDIGAGSTKLTYYINGAVALTSNIPLGGSHFTHDIAVGLRTPQTAAEIMKKKYGIALASLVASDEMIEVESVGGRNARTVMRRDLAEILEPRAEELLQMIRHDLRLSGFLQVLGSGVVLTGGGSELNGLIEMSEYFLDIPVRRGFPTTFGGLVDVVKTPSFATALGLLLYGQKKNRFSKGRLKQAPIANASAGGNVTETKIKSKFIEFFEDLFK